MDGSTTAGPIGSDGDPGHPVPRRVGAYRLGRKIGEGGMGVVYAGTHERLGRTVAIKFIGFGRPSPEMLRRFDQERDVLSTLSHPAIAQVFDAGEAEYGGEIAPYIVMEYVVGAQTVREYCATTRLPLLRLLEMFELLFDALEHAHGKGIVHRDLTPRNILVDSEGRPKIIDFGLSLPLGARGAVESLDAEAGNPAGTPAYMSPEQRTGDPHAIDHRTDIYSLALVMHEVISDARDRGEGPPESVRPEIDALLVECLGKSPTDRPARASSVRARLESAREQLISGSAGAARASGARGLLPAPLAGLLVAFAAAASAFGVLPLLCAVLHVCMWYSNVAVSAMSGPPLSGVRVVTLSVDMLDSEHMRVNGETPDIFALRGKHAELLDRLVDAGASAVAMDLRFGRVTEHDEGFAEGIRRAIDRGVPVVLFDKYWLRTREGDDYAPAMLSAASQVAPGTGSFYSDSPWKADIAARLGDGFLLPSLSLATFARVRHADVYLSLSADLDKQAVHVRRWKPAAGGEPKQVGPMLSVPISGWTKGNEMAAAVGLSQGDHVAQVLLTVPPDDVLDSISIRYDDVLDPDGGFDPDLVRDRVVLIGRTDDMLDIKQYPDGRAIPGVYAHAVAVDGLQRNVVTRAVHDNVMRALCAAAGVIGVGILLASGLRTRTRWLVVGGVAVGMIAACLAALPFRQIVYPSPLVGSLMLGAALSAGLTALWTRRSAVIPKSEA